jgi:hypothetical protein
MAARCRRPSRTDGHARPLPATAAAHAPTPGSAHTGRPNARLATHAGSRGLRRGTQFGGPQRRPHHPQQPCRSGRLDLFQSEPEGSASTPCAQARSPLPRWNEWSPPENSTLTPPQRPPPSHGSEFRAFGRRSTGRLGYGPFGYGPDALYWTFWDAADPLAHGDHAPAGRITCGYVTWAKSATISRASSSRY